MRIEILGGLVGIISVVGIASGQARMQGLGRTPAGGISVNSSVAMSADGMTIVTSVERRSFRWRQSEGWQELQPLPISGLRSATVRGISANGRFTVGTSLSASNPFKNQAVIWDELGSPLALGDLPGGSFESYGHGVSDNGNVVVGAVQTPGGTNIFRWVRGEGMSNLGGTATPDADFYRASCSANGAIIFGSSGGSGPRRAQRWAGSWVTLGDLPGGNRGSWVHGIAPSGGYAVGEMTTAEGVVGYVWSLERGLEWLGLSPFGTTTETFAYGVSEGGTTVVGSGPTGWLSRATVWDRANGWRNLKLVLLTEYGITEANAWTMHDAIAVSADGLTIAGRGVNPCSSDDIWLVRLLPQTANCPPDFNADGFLDFFDYDAFIQAFEVGIPAADFNGDCFLDFFDYDSFVEAFEAGC
jgi:uncharacterized membrane protein